MTQNTKTIKIKTTKEKGENKMQNATSLMAVTHTHTHTQDNLIKKIKHKGMIYLCNFKLRKII